MKKLHTQTTYSVLLAALMMMSHNSKFDRLAERGEMHFLVKRAILRFLSPDLL